jgi:hypothetical protein
MFSTQRSKSMNAIFNDYLNSSIILKVFVEQFDNALWHKVENEIKSNFEFFKGKPYCVSLSPMMFLSGCK